MTGRTLRALAAVTAATMALVITQPTVAAAASDRCKIIKPNPSSKGWVEVCHEFRWNGRYSESLRAKLYDGTVGVKRWGNGGATVEVWLLLDGHGTKEKLAGPGETNWHWYHDQTEVYLRACRVVCSKWW